MKLNLKYLLAPWTGRRGARAAILSCISFSLFLFSPQTWSQDSDWSTRAAYSKWAQFPFAGLFYGPLPLEQNADTVTQAGVLSRLFWISALLEQWGPEHRFETELSWSYSEQSPSLAYQMKWKVQGDPTWGRPEFGEDAHTRVTQLAQILTDYGVKKIVGPIQLDEEHFSENENKPTHALPTGWSPSQRHTCDAAPIAALNLNQNCATFRITGPNTGVWLDDSQTLREKVKVSLRTSKRTQIRVVSLNPAQSEAHPTSHPFDWTELDSDGSIRSQTENNPIALRKIAGKVRADAFPIDVQLPILEPRARVGDFFKLALSEQKIDFQSENAWSMTTDSYPTRTQTIRIVSPPLRLWLKILLDPREVWFAEAVFRLWGGDSPHFKLRDYLDHHFSEDRHTVIWDGSGTSLANTTSARSVFRVLERLSQSPHFKHFWDALIVAGDPEHIWKNQMNPGLAHGIVRGIGSMQGEAFTHRAGYVPRFNSVGEIDAILPFVLLDLEKTPSFDADRDSSRNSSSFQILPRSAPYKNSIEKDQMLDDLLEEVTQLINQG